MSVAVTALIGSLNSTAFRQERATLTVNALPFYRFSFSTVQVGRLSGDGFCRHNRGLGLDCASIELTKEFL